MFRLLFYFLSFIFVFAFHQILKILLSSFTPHLFLLQVVYFALFYSSRISMIYGFIVGIIIDIFSITPIGLQSFVFVLISYIVGKLEEKIEKTNIFTQVIISLFASILYIACHYFFVKILPSIETRSLLIGEYFSILTTSAVAPLFFKLLHWWDRVITQILYSKY
jgi:rod shape-determining protein MreD